MKSNSSEILLELIASLFLFISFFFALKVRLKTSSLSFVSLSWSRTTDKLAINWKNFARVQLQLKFASSLIQYKYIFLYILQPETKLQV